MLRRRQPSQSQVKVYHDLLACQKAPGFIAIRDKMQKKHPNNTTLQ
jgi:hypothetical protein